MGVVVADCAIHFGQQGYCGNLGPCSNQAHHYIGNFLANSGRAGGLTVGPAQHRFCCIGLRHLAHLGNQFVQRGEQNQVAAAFELQRVTGVVDVFTGTGKVHKLACFLKLGPGFKFGFDPVLDRLDVVVGGFLNFLDRQGVGFGKVFHQTKRVSARSRAQRLELGKSGI